MGRYPSWLVGVTGMSNEAFWALVAIPTVTPAGGDPAGGEGIDANTCWLWRGRRNPDGYGRYDVGARVWQAHRYAYEQVKGPIPAGYVVVHTCANRQCVRPTHLEATSRREHRRRRLSVNAPERFWNRVAKNDPQRDPAGCWLWLGKAPTSGYPRIRAQGAYTTAYQYAYALTYGGPPAADLKLIHLCRNPCCVRPDHLRPASQFDVSRRYWQSTTQCKHGHALTPENTYERGDGARHCRVCRRERVHRYRLKARARAAGREGVGGAQARIEDRTEARVEARVEARTEAGGGTAERGAQGIPGAVERVTVSARSLGEPGERV